MKPTRNIYQISPTQHWLCFNRRSRTSSSPATSCIQITSTSCRCAPVTRLRTRFPISPWRPSTIDWTALVVAASWWGSVATSTWPLVSGDVSRLGPTSTWTRAWTPCPCTRCRVTTSSASAPIRVEKKEKDWRKLWLELKTATLKKPNSKQRLRWKFNTRATKHYKIYSSNENKKLVAVNIFFSYFEANFIFIKYFNRIHKYSTSLKTSFVTTQNENKQYYVFLSNLI